MQRTLELHLPGTDSEHPAAMANQTGVPAFTELSGNDTQVLVRKKLKAWEGMRKRLPVFIPAAREEMAEIRERKQCSRKLLAQTTLVASSSSKADAYFLLLVTLNTLVGKVFPHTFIQKEFDHTSPHKFC